MTLRRFSGLCVMGLSLIYTLNHIELAYAIVVAAVLAFALVTIWILLSGYGYRASERELQAQRSVFIANLVRVALSSGEDVVYVDPAKITYHANRARIILDMPTPRYPGFEARIQKRMRVFGESARFAYEPEQRSYYLDIDEG